MKKRMLSLALTLALTLGLVPATQAAGQTFTDVPADAWYAQAVALCAEEGVMVGTGEGVFSPDETLSYNQCLTLALRLYDLLHGGDGVFEPAPKAERKNAITLTFADGTSLTSYGYHQYQPLPELENHMFYSDWWQWGDGTNNFFQLGLKPDGLEPVRDDDPDTLAAYDAAKAAATAWATAHEGPATLTVGDITFTGTVQCWAPGGYPELAFHNKDVGDREEHRAKMAALRKAVFDETNTVPKAAPANWWQDGAWYLAQQGELHNTSYQLKFLHEDQAASRWDFAEVLYAVLGELPAVRTVDVPDLERGYRSPAAYHLYEAGILTGVDAYGTFDGDGSFTRAQAAVMVARVLDESLRVSDPLASLPTEGYTLTYLMDGSPDCGVRYPVCVLGSSEENEGHVGVLLLDGTLLPWPGTGTPSSALGPCGDYVYFGVYDEATENPYDTKAGLMDRNGDFVVPMENGRGQLTYAIEGGFFSELYSADGFPVWTLLDENGQLIREVPVENADPESLYPPKARQPYHGIEDVNGHYYVDANGNPISQKFDWAGHITDDGQGFVGLEGKIYRIQFAY